MPHTRSFDARDLAVAVMMNLLWGANVVAVKEAVASVDPLTAALLRQAIVLGCCLPWLSIVPGRMGPLLLLGTLTGGLFYVLINLSMSLATNVGALAIAAQLGVPFSMILAVVVLKERIHRIRIIGVALSLAGVAILLFDPAALGELPALALTALSSLVWAIGSLVQKRLDDVPVPVIYAWLAAVGCAILLPVALVAEPGALARAAAGPPSALGWIAFSAVGSTLLGHGSLAWLIQRHDVSQVMPLTLAAPVLSVASAALWFGTPVTGIMVLGGLVALAGVAIVTVRSATVARAERGPQRL